MNINSNRAGVAPYLDHQACHLVIYRERPHQCVLTVLRDGPQLLLLLPFPAAIPTHKANVNDKSVNKHHNNNTSVRPSNLVVGQVNYPIYSKGKLKHASSLSLLLTDCHGRSSSNVNLIAIATV